MSGDAIVGVLPALTDQRAATRPHAPALHTGHAIVDYAGLRQRIDALAGRIAATAPRQAVVAGCFERGPDLVVAFLATLRAGAVWLPLDPSYPRARLEFMLQDAEPALLLASEAPPAWLSAGRPLLLTGGEGAHPVPPPPRPDELAYLIYTSGSTGEPKGVMVEHRGLVNLGRCQAELFGLDGDGRVLQVASPNFDAFVSEVAMTLWAGACLHLAPRADLMPGPGLAATLAARSITHVTLSPAALGVMQPSDLAPDLALLLAGEAWGEGLLRRRRGRRPSAVRLPGSRSCC
jgi:non-ribosomal peptide synthetase component F